MWKFKTFSSFFEHFILFPIPNLYISNNVYFLKSFQVVQMLNSILYISCFKCTREIVLGVR